MLFVTMSNATVASTKQCNSVPMPFVKNMGQAPTDIAYYVNTPNANVLINKNGDIDYGFILGHERGMHVIKEKLLNANPVISAHQKQTTQINIIKGKNKKNWHNPTD